MKSAFILATVILFSGCQKQERSRLTSLESRRDSVSYAIGLNIGANMLRDSVEINPDPLVQGIADAASDSSSRLLNENQVQSVIMSYQEELTQKHLANVGKQAEANRQKEQQFLEENKNKPGVVTLASGLQYKVIKEGTGAKPVQGNQVTAHYRGTLIDGSEFDSSYKRGEPSTFRLNNVIAGWTEALQLMKVGSKWELYIPAHLAYGEQGSGPIGPNQTLIFELELVGIQ